MGLCETSLSSLSVVLAIWKFAHILTATVSILWGGFKVWMGNFVNDVTLRHSIQQWDNGLKDNNTVKTKESQLTAQGALPLFCLLVFILFPIPVSISTSIPIPVPVSVPITSSSPVTITPSSRRWARPTARWTGPIPSPGRVWTTTMLMESVRWTSVQWTY